jgi:dTDP-4-dehydrorhamnose 3,5-epimerase
MKFETCEINGLVICKPKIISDKRGFFTETFRKDLFDNFIGERSSFCQTNCSESKYGTIRGLHFQISPSSQSKLVSVQSGEILDVVLDLRKNSKTFGKYFSVILNDINNYQFFIPSGFAHGFSVLSEKARVQYMVDNFFDKKNEFGINPLDKNLDINWKVENPMISEKDISSPNFDKNQHYNF